MAMKAEDEVIQDLNALADIGLSDRPRINKAIEYVKNNVEEIREFRVSMKVADISDYILMRV